MSKTAAPAPKKKGPHRPVDTIARIPYCIKCGVVYLKNDATRKAINSPCPGDE